MDDVERAVSWYQHIFAGELDRSGLPPVVVGDVQLGFNTADGNTPQGVGGTVPYCGVDSLDAVAEKFIYRGAVVYDGPSKLMTLVESARSRSRSGNVFGLIRLTASERPARFARTARERHEPGAR